jgi:IMP dehydrogenase
MDFKKKIIGEGITFDDVLLVPAMSDVLPSEVDVSTYFTKRVKINIPLSSAGLDTVTDNRLAIALAYEGGIGVIHRNMGEKQQAKEVTLVKKRRSGIIDEPYTLKPDSKVRNVKEFGHSVIVTDKYNLVLGIVTKRDIIGKDLEAKLKDVMTGKEKLVTAYRNDVLKEGSLDTEKIQGILSAHKVEKLILVDKDYLLDGLITQGDLFDIKDYPNQAVDSQGRLICAAAIGPMEYERAEALIKKEVDVIVIDCAHGHSQNVIDTIRCLNSNYKDRKFDIVAGNIATYEAAKALIEAGADALKVGIGPGSICTTRIIAGVGVPQIEAIMESAKCAREKGIPVIADGGIRYSGDITKAIAAGAGSVMIGSLFARTTESPGESVIIDGKKMKVYRGMGSEGAMRDGSARKHGRYSGKCVAEGVEGVVPESGSLADYVYQLVGGLRSGMGYCGCRTIKELVDKAEFIMVTGAGMVESHPHGILITKEARNYPLQEGDKRQ